MDRSAWIWSAATASGVIALMLMLVWQLGNLTPISADVDVAGAQSEESAEKAPAKANDSIAGSPSHKVAPPNQWEPEDRSQPTWRGIKIKGSSRFSDPMSKERASNVRSPFATPPNNAADNSTSASPFDNSPDRKALTEAAPAGSPFKPKPEVQPAETSTAPKSIAGTPARESSNPFATNSKVNPPADEKTSPFAVQPEPVKASAAPPQSASDSNTLSIELVRVGSSKAAVNDDQFLVTSLETPGESPESKLNTGSHTTGPDGWIVATRKNSQRSIVPIRHGVGASVMTGAASITTLWTVAAPRLRFEIIAPQRAAVGERLPIQLRVSNTGTAAATGVKLQIDLPETLTYHVGQKLEHQVGRLEPGETRTARLTPKVVAAGTINLPAVAVADDGIRSPATRRNKFASKAKTAGTTAAVNPRGDQQPAKRKRPASVEYYDGRRIILIRR